jgi:hypothetical protein
MLGTKNVLCTYIYSKTILLKHENYPVMLVSVLLKMETYLGNEV